MTAETILAIESAVSGGSIALIAGRQVIGRWHSEEAVSRSEELLPRIAESLEMSGITTRDLTQVAISNGPGSFTGIRAGLATAMGLAHALSIPCIGVSLLRAIGSAEGVSGDRIALVPLGRNGYAWQYFADSDVKFGTGAVHSGSMDDFAERIERHPGTVLAHSDAFQRLIERGSRFSRTGSIVDFGRDLAVAVGIASITADDGLEPFYARDVRSSPAVGVSS